MRGFPRETHYVYVIELSPEAWNHAKFRRANPDRDPEKPLLYVGMTGLTPEIRFERHKYGVVGQQVRSGVRGETQTRSL